MISNYVIVSHIFYLRVGKNHHPQVWDITGR